MGTSQDLQFAPGGSSRQFPNAFVSSLQRYFSGLNCGDLLVPWVDVLKVRGSPQVEGGCWQAGRDPGPLGPEPGGRWQGSPPDVSILIIVIGEEMNSSKDRGKQALGVDYVVLKTRGSGGVT